MVHFRVDAILVEILNLNFVTILMLKFGQDFDAEIWSRF